MTRTRSVSAAMNAPILCGSVVTGHSSSEIPMSSFSLRPPAVGSEHTTRHNSGRVVCRSHSRRAWETSAMVGAAKRMRPPAPTVCSAILRDVKVLPVPQAMMRRPRSWLPRPPTTCSIASFWSSQVPGQVLRHLPRVAAPARSRRSRFGRPGDWHP